MKTTNSERVAIGMDIFGSFPTKKGSHWNNRRRYVAMSYFKTASPL